MDYVPLFCQLLYGNSMVLSRELGIYSKRHAVWRDACVLLRG